MPQPLNLVGERFGKLRVLELAGSIKTSRYWYCECDCGTWQLAATGQLRNGQRVSCGCARKSSNPDTTGNRSPEYRAWSHMKRTTKDYPQSWKYFENFIRDLGRRPSDKHKLARHDINKPHGTTNTYWRNANAEREHRRQQELSDGFYIDMSRVSDTH